MNKVLLTILFLVNSFVVWSQMLDNSEGKLFTDESFFNQKFIFNNKIKQINAEVSVKKEMKAIKNTALFEKYQFNSNGKLSVQMSTYHVIGGKIDTSVVYYSYNEDNKQINKLLCDANGFFQHKYQLDENNNIVKQTYSRIENLGNSKLDFFPGKEYIILEETFSYDIISANEIKKTYYNASDKPYKETTYLLDDFGNKIEEIDRYIVTNRKTSIKYTFNEFHQLVMKEDYSAFFGDNKMRSEYFYDKIGNIEKELFYRNDKLVRTTEYLYQKQTMLLDAKLIKDEDTGTIRIFEYSYKFY